MLIPFKRKQTDLEKTDKAIRLKLYPIIQHLLFEPFLEYCLDQDIICSDNVFDLDWYRADKKQKKFLF